MKQKNSLFTMVRRAALLGSILIFGGLVARAQAVIPTVCLTPNSRAGTTTLTSNASAGDFQVRLGGGSLPTTFRIVINPGGATEETIAWAVPRYYYDSLYSLYSASGNGRRLTYAHNAGETVQWFTDVTATFGYNNTGSSTQTIPRGLSDLNFFSPGALTYAQQITTFLPGIHSSAFSLDLPLPDGFRLTWYLVEREATVSKDSPLCAMITYQGRLTDAGGAATGTYDLQFTAFDRLTGGAAQSSAILVEDTLVVNGVFTAQLNFAASFYGNNNARYLEIGIRPGNSTGAFTVLTPRQPITTVPFAVNAQTSLNATNATNATNAAQLNGVAANQYVLTTDPRLSNTNNASFIQNSATPQTANFNISGNGTVGGSLNVTGAITSGCRAGFTAFASGRLCVGAMKPAALFLEAIQDCANDSTRVGNSGDVILTLGSNANFNYFGGLPQGWLADNMGSNLWGTWKISFANADFAGAPANGTAAGPRLPYRCVY